MLDTFLRFLLLIFIQLLIRIIFVLSTIISFFWILIFMRVPEFHYKVLSLFDEDRITLEEDLLDKPKIYFN